MLERATLWAFELEDEEVTGLHLLLALTQEWESRPAALARARPEVLPAALPRA